MKSRVHVFLIAALVLVLFGYATAQAPQPVLLEQAHSFSLPLVGSPPTTSFSVPQFDPRLGTLVSASIEVDTHHVQDYGVEQLGLGRANFYFGDGPISSSDSACFSHLQISAPSGETVCSDLNLWPLVKMPLGRFDGAVDFMGPSGTTTQLDATSNLAPVSMDTTGLIGAGNATFAVTRSGFVWHSGTTANVHAFYQRRIGATGSVTYVYQ